MIIHDLDVDKDPKAIEFNKISIGSVFRGKNGYISYSLFLKVTDGLIFDLENNKIAVTAVTDIFYQYEPLEVMLNIRRKVR